MSEYRALLEEEERRFELPPGGFDRLVRRRDSKRRTKQIGALVFTLVLLAVVLGGAVSVFRSADRRHPANPSETPTPHGEPVRPLTLDQRLDVAAAWGEIDGVRWAVWTNDDLSCLAFTSAGGGDYSGYYAEVGGRRCHNGFDGSDVKLTGACAYACPVPKHPVLYGTVSERVASVEFVVDDGTTYVGTIYPRPSDVTVDGRVFTLQVARRFFTGTLAALAPDGSVLEQLRWPPGTDRRDGPSMPITVEAILASGVPTSALDGRPAEDERWEFAIWRTATGEWCLGTNFPNVSQTVVATEGPGCGARGDLFQGIRRGAIGHADIWWTDESSMFGEQGNWFRYRVVGTISDEVASVRIELDDGQIAEAELHDPLPGFEDMGRLFVVEFRSKDHPRAFEGTGGITWNAIALDANGQVLGSDDMSM